MKKILLKLAIFLFLTLNTTNAICSSIKFNLKGKRVSVINVKDLGALGNGTHDDDSAFFKAFHSNADIILIPKSSSYYKLSGYMIITNIKNKKIIASGAKILNNDIKGANIMFQNCQNLELLGGDWGYVVKPASNGGNNQHVFQFDQCKNVILNKLHIICSPEVGIAITNSNNVVVKNCLIENTFRDGIYSHYSANVKYLYNTLRNIKDDALSFHDYGIDEQKKPLLKFGYTNSYNVLVEGNIVENAYQGFSSIGSHVIKVKSNTIKNTVLSGIAIFNSKELFVSGKAYAERIYILSNIIINPCKTTTIIGAPYINFGQASTGRAAIFVGALGDDNQINKGEDKHLKSVYIRDNIVKYSGAHGFWGALIDSLQFINNKFTNCSGYSPKETLSGDVIEIKDCSLVTLDGNSVLDTRKPTRHVHGYTLINVDGSSKRWSISGVTKSSNVIRGGNVRK